MKKSIVNSVLWLKTKLNVQTWVIESSFVLIVLLTTAIISNKGWVEYVAVLSVYFTFKHASVAERMREADEANSQVIGASTTSCAPKLNRFFYAKEILWIAYFLLIGAYSALAGCGIFLLYGWWRKAYRQIHSKSIKGNQTERKFYRHFKHRHKTNLEGVYELLHIVENTETYTLSVIYRPLYKLPNIPITTALSRPWKNFFEDVEVVENGATVKVKRFEQIDPTKEMLKAIANLYS